MSFVPLVDIQRFERAVSGPSGMDPPEKKKKQLVRFQPWYAESIFDR